MDTIKEGDLRTLKWLLHHGYKFDKNIIQICVRRAPQDKRLALCQFLITSGYRPAGLLWICDEICHSDKLPSYKMEIVKLLTGTDKFSLTTMNRVFRTLVKSLNMSSLRLMKYLVFIGTEVTSSLDGLTRTKTGPFLRAFSDYIYYHLDCNSWERLHKVFRDNVFSSGEAWLIRNLRMVE